MALAKSPELKAARVIAQERLPLTTMNLALAMVRAAKLSDPREAAKLVVVSSLIAEPLVKYEDLAELTPDFEEAREFRKRLRDLRRYIRGLSEPRQMEFDLLLPGEEVRFGPEGPVSTPIRTTFGSLADLAEELARWEAAFDEAYSDLSAKNSDPRPRRTRLRQNIVAKLANIFDHFHPKTPGASGFRLSYIERVLEAAGMEPAPRTVQNWLDASSYPREVMDFLEHGHDNFWVAARF